MGRHCHRVWFPVRSDVTDFVCEELLIVDYELEASDPHASLTKWSGRESPGGARTR
jgi:hypothetical protein